MTRLKTVTLSEVDHRMLRDLVSKLGARSMRSLLAQLVNDAYKHSSLITFDRALTEALRQSSDLVGFEQYLEQPHIVDLLTLLDSTRPRYKDIAMMQATLLFWDIEPRQFFETLMTYAKFGLAEFKGEVE